MRFYVVVFFFLSGMILLDSVEVLLEYSSNKVTVGD